MLLGRIKVRDRVVLVAPLLEARSRLVAAVRAGTTGQTDTEQNDRGDSEDTDDDS